MGRRIHAEKIEQVARPSDPPVQVTTEDALRFLASVRREFRDKYEELMPLLLEFSRGRMDADSVISRVKVLFEGHPHLIIGFNVFLPEGQKIEILDGEEAST